MRMRRGWGYKPALGPVRNSRSGNPEGPGRQSRVQSRARGTAEARLGPGGAPPPPAAAAPVRPRSPRRGAPCCLTAHTRTTLSTRVGAAPPQAAGEMRSGTSLSPRPSAPPPRPGPRAAARKTLHSPEFLHVCGRGLRETKREGQQAGGVRSVAAPGGAGHRAGTGGRGGGAPPRGSLGGKPGPRAPSLPPPAAVRGTQWVRGAAAE